MFLKVYKHYWNEMVFFFFCVSSNLENFKEWQDFFDCCGNKTLSPTPTPPEEKNTTLSSSLGRGIL